MANLFQHVSKFSSTLSSPTLQFPDSINCDIISKLFSDKDGRSNPDKMIFQSNLCYQTKQKPFRMQKRNTLASQASRFSCMMCFDSQSHSLP